MRERTDIVIVGAGPAGLSAADVLGEAGLNVVVLDDQPAPGGQVYRAIGKANQPLGDVLGPDYTKGASLLKGLEHGNVEYRPGATVWQVTGEREVCYSIDGRGHTVTGDRVILATGAMERPMPFPGWTLPGVMTIGGAQTLLKSSGLIWDGPIVLAGSGPLLYLFAAQAVRIGADVTMVLETAPKPDPTKVLAGLAGFVTAPGYLAKGLTLLKELRKAGIPRVSRVHELKATGDGHIETVRYRAGNKWQEQPTSQLLIHQGVVPNTQITRSLELPHDWSAQQRCWRPRVNEDLTTDLDGILVAGDGAGISGADAAVHQGCLAAVSAMSGLDGVDPAGFSARADKARAALHRHLKARPFLDALYRPHQAFLTPEDDTVICRCEEVTAGDVRRYVTLGCLGPNQTKAFGRPGMGPCQGRFCGLTVSEIIAAERGVVMDDVGYYRIRSPIKPVTLGEVADTAGDEEVVL